MSFLVRKMSQTQLLLQPGCLPVFLRTAAGCAGDKRENRGIVLGVYTPIKAFEGAQLTPAAKVYNDQTCGRLLELIKVSGPCPRKGEARIFFDLTQEFTSVAIVGLGKECQGYNDVEQIDEGKETIRLAAAAGCQALQKLQVVRIMVEGFGHAESAAEGAGLGIWLYQELRNPKKQIRVPQLELFNDCDWTGWQIGLQKAAAQNLSRQLTDTPANLMTPTMFAQNAVEVLCKSGVNVEVKVRGWAETQKMGAFLHVSKGSCEPPIFLELSYYGAAYDERPIVLIGSGITYDSGGLCVKEKRDLVNMRGDLAGAACVVATARALAALQLPLNIRGLIPLCENMPGCSAMKPGDIVRAMSGQNILIEDTRSEGRLVLADTLFYSQNFWPRFVVDVGTLTRDTYRAMDTAATAVFTNSDPLWDKVHMAGVHTGDRMFRYPLWNFFRRQVRHTTSSDIRNRGDGIGADHCKAAAFLREFVPCGEWMHMDTYNVMKSTGKNYPYLRKGMSGRPTRTLIEFLSQLVCKTC